MKKVIAIIAVVIAVAAGTYFADKATRVPHKSVARADSQAAGTPAPDLTLKELDGKDVSLAQFKGKVVLVNFWATWCDPCRYEIPSLIEMQKKYGDRGFTVLGVAMDDEGKRAVAPFVEKERFDVNGAKLPMNYPILIGNDEAGNKFGGLLGYPTSVLINRDGKQIKRITGLISEEEISKAIEANL
jgi:thiol-disulfide isomerase/thioredoxin